MRICADIKTMANKQFLISLAIAIPLGAVLLWIALTAVSRAVTPNAAYGLRVEKGRNPSR